MGIVAIAAAERAAIAHPFSELSWARAGLLGGGVAVFLAGDALFCRALEVGSGRRRAAAAVLAVATTPLGAAAWAAAQIGALVVVLVGSIDTRPGRS